MANRIIHFEIPSDDPKKAVKFYEDVFGWGFNDWGEQQTYWLATTGNDTDPGINGAILKRATPTTSLSNTISVDSIHDTIEKIKKHGGKILSEVMPVQGMGWVAYFSDIDGNIFSIMQSDPNAK